MEKSDPSGFERVYEDILDTIVEVLSSDFDTLANLCRVSRIWVPLTRKRLYRELYLELDLHESIISKQWLKKASTVILDNNHLWTYVKSLTASMTVSDDGDVYVRPGGLDWMSITSERTSNVEHISLLCWTNQTYTQEISELTHSIRSQVEDILGGQAVKSMLLYLDHAPNHPAFPGWIFRAIPATVTKLSIVSRADFFSSATSGPPANTEVSLRNSAPTGCVQTGDAVEPSPPHYLDEFSLNLLSPREDFAPWAALFAETRFNLNLAQTRKLTIPHRHDKDMWKLADGASDSLEELKIMHCSNHHEPLPPNLFVQYSMLHTLSLVVSAVQTAGPLMVMDVFSQSLPSSLRRVVIQIDYKFILSGKYEFPYSAGDPDGIVSANIWRDLDEKISHKPNLALNSVTLELKWLYTGPSSEARCVFQNQVDIFRKAKEAWGEKANAFLAKWRKLFVGVDKMGLLDLRINRASRSGC